MAGYGPHVECPKCHKMVCQYPGTTRFVPHKCSSRTLIDELQDTIRNQSDRLYHLENELARCKRLDSLQMEALRATVALLTAISKR